MTAVVGGALHVTLGPPYRGPKPWLRGLSRTVDPDAALGVPGSRAIAWSTLHVFSVPLGAPATLMAVKPSVQFRRDAEALRQFRDAFVALVNASRSYQPVFMTQLGPGVPQEQWNKLRTQVALAAGRAQPAYNRHGGVFALRNAAYRMNGVSPVTNWEMCLRDPEQLPPHTVVSAVEGAIGLAETRGVEAGEREKGIVGLVAAFLRWPTTLREAVGPDHTTQRRAASALGVVAQFIVGVLASTIAAGVVALIVMLWQATS